MACSPFPHRCDGEGSPPNGAPLRACGWRAEGGLGYLVADGGARATLTYRKFAIYHPAMTWRVDILNETVAAEIAALPADMQARFLRVAERIADLGLERVGEPHVKHIQGKLWEMRMTGRDGIARALYVTATGRRVVVVRAFVKKTQKTPRAEIEIALKRAEEIAP